MAIRRRILLSLAGIVVAGLAGCGGGDGPATAAPASLGTVRIALTDAPACGFDQVNITVQRIRIHRSGNAGDADSGWTDIAVSPPRKVDLLTLTNGVLLELGQAQLSAGLYTQLRLVLSPNGAGSPANSVVPSGGAETPLDTPSAVQSGIKLIHPFTVEAGRLVDLVLDFDPCRSVVQRGNGSFGLKPVIAVLPRTLNGIVGTVDPAISGITVSAQKDGVVLRATIPNANGEFVLSPIDPAKTPYEVVFTAPGQATAVITGVPVTADVLTRVSTSATPITLLASTVGVANGKVLPTAAEAAVRALQMIGTVPKVEVAHVNVDGAGNYALSLPLASPRVATYSTTLPLSFTADAANAAKYAIEASAAGYVTQTKPVTVGAVPVITDFTLVPAP
jgi:hypothetical protein